VCKLFSPPIYKHQILNSVIDWKCFWFLWNRFLWNQNQINHWSCIKNPLQRTNSFHMKESAMNWCIYGWVIWISSKYLRTVPYIPESGLWCFGESGRLRILRTNLIRVGGGFFLFLITAQQLHYTSCICTDAKSNSISHYFKTWTSSKLLLTSHCTTCDGLVLVISFGGI